MTDNPVPAKAGIVERLRNKPMLLTRSIQSQAALEGASMRNLRELDAYRISAKATHGWDGDHTCGAFRLPSPIDGQPLVIIASSGDGWDHVSVSRSSRCPNWPEMEFIKRRFFRDDETVMQLHVPVSDHINAHSNCLHLWRPQQGEIPRPPTLMV